MNQSTVGANILRALFQPTAAFENLASANPSFVRIVTRYAIWLLLLPPMFSWLGGYTFGWRIGAAEPLYMTPTELTLVSVSYLVVLLFGFGSTVVVSRWMATTYGATQAAGTHAALVTIVAAPLVVWSVAHLYPNVFVNVLALIPTLIWSMYLLYKGIPLALGVPPERGMLMASSLVGWLLVAAVSLLGLTMVLWTAGIGPQLGV